MSKPVRAPAFLTCYKIIIKISKTKEELDALTNTSVDIKTLGLNVKVFKTF
jgi:hypothetical protein